MKTDICFVPWHHGHTGAVKDRSVDVLWLLQVNEGDVATKDSLLTLSIPGRSCTRDAERCNWGHLLALSRLLEKLTQVAFMSTNAHGEEMRGPHLSFALGACISSQWIPLVCSMLLYQKPPSLPTFAFHVPGTDIWHNV